MKKGLVFLAFLFLCVNTGWAKSGETDENISRLELQLENGSSSAARELYYAYSDKSSDVYDFDKAYQYIHQAALLGDVRANSILGYFHAYLGEEGGFVEFSELTDYSESFRWYLRGAQLGDPQAQAQVSTLYNKGLGIDQDYQKSFYWAERAHQGGDELGALQLALIYSEGIGIEQDAGMAIDLYTEMAVSGSELAAVESMFRLGEIYQYGLGIDVDYIEAAKWHEMAANKGNANSQNELGLLYGEGYGVRQDSRVAIYWLKKAASQGHAMAQSNLGTIYLKGYGVEKNLEEALHWFTLSLDQGSAKAMYELGVIFLENGNDKIALDHWMSASDNGNVLAMNAIALYMFEADMKDHSFYWYGKAAATDPTSGQEGVAFAQGQLGLMYFTGSGVDQDTVKAVGWLELALSNGLQDNSIKTTLTYIFMEDGFQRGNAEMFQKAIGVCESCALYWLEEWTETDDFQQRGYKFKIEFMLFLANSFKQATSERADNREYNNSRALYWLQSAAEKSLLSEKYLFGEIAELIGLLYRDRESLKDLELAKLWFLKSAELGSVYSKYALGDILCDYEGDPLGIDFLEEAHNIGSLSATYELADNYVYGRCTNPDIEKAKEFLGIIGSSLEPNEITEDPELSKRVDTLTQIVNYSDSRGLSSAEYQKLINGRSEAILEITAKDSIQSEISLAVAQLYNENELDDAGALATLEVLKSGHPEAGYSIVLYKFAQSGYDIREAEVSLEYTLTYAKNGYRGGSDCFVWAELYHATVPFVLYDGNAKLVERLLRSLSSECDLSKHPKIELFHSMRLADLSLGDRFEFYSRAVQRLLSDEFSDDMTGFSNETLLGDASAGLAEAYVKRGDYENALNILLSFDGHQSYGYNLALISTYYSRLGSLEKAQEYLSKLELLNDPFTVLNTVRINVLLLEGKFAAAMSLERELFHDERPVTTSNIDQYLYDIDFVIKAGHLGEAHLTLEVLIDKYAGYLRKRVINNDSLTLEDKVQFKSVAFQFLDLGEKMGVKQKDLGLDIIQTTTGLSAAEGILNAISRKQLGGTLSIKIQAQEELRAKKNALVKQKLGDLLEINDSDRLILNQQLNEIDSDLTQINNEISELRSNDESLEKFVISKDVLQTAMLEGDGLITTLISDQGSYVWLITKSGVYRSKSALTGGEIESYVATILSSIDSKENQGEGFSFESSQALYSFLIEPFHDELSGLDRLIFVPGSELSNLPFSILTRHASETMGESSEAILELDSRGFSMVSITNKPNKKSFHWLIEDYAIAIAPSIYSYVELLGVNQRQSPNSQSFIGIGDPILSGDNKYVNKSQLLEAINLRGSEAGVLSSLAPLPETKFELTSIGKSFQSSVIMTGDEATEIRLKGVDLERFGVIAFATHALVAEELDGVVEPSLVLTPGAGNQNNDGLLTASEVAELKLDADIVLLSACNTAASSNTGSTEGLTGLASAFFQAGARSVLVSYWPVISDAAVEITTSMFDKSNRGVSYSHRHRESILKLLKNPDSYRASPVYWAPFMVIGVN